MFQKLLGTCLIVLQDLSGLAIDPEDLTYRNDPNTSQMFLFLSVMTV